MLFRFLAFRSLTLNLFPISGFRIGTPTCSIGASCGGRYPKIESMEKSTQSSRWSMEPMSGDPKPVIPACSIFMPGELQMPSIGLFLVFLLHVATGPRSGCRSLSALMRPQVSICRAASLFHVSSLTTARASETTLVSSCPSLSQANPLNIVLYA